MKTIRRYVIDQDFIDNQNLKYLKMLILLNTLADLNAL